MTCVVPRIVELRSPRDDGYSFVGHSTNNNRVTMHDISFENCRASAPFAVMHGIEAGGLRSELDGRAG